MRVRDDEPRGAAIHGKRQLAPAMYVLRAERILVAHQSEAPADLAVEALEVLWRAATDIADLRGYAATRRRLRAQQRIAREARAVLQQHGRLMQPPSCVRYRLDTDLRPDRREALLREIERLRFAF